MLWMLLIPTTITYLGVVSNQLVLITNGNRFPVLVNDKKIGKYGGVESGGMLGGDDDLHCRMTPKTHLNALADIFDEKDGTASIGDFLIEGGENIAYYCYLLWVFLVCSKLLSSA